MLVLEKKPNSQSQGTWSMHYFQNSIQEMTVVKIGRKFHKSTVAIPRERGQWPKTCPQRIDQAFTFQKREQRQMLKVHITGGLNSLAKQAVLCNPWSGWSWLSLDGKLCFWVTRKVAVVCGGSSSFSHGIFICQLISSCIQGDCRKENQGRINSFGFRAKTGDVQILHPVLVTLIWCIGGGRGLAASDRHSLNDLHIYVQSWARIWPKLYCSKRNRCKRTPSC